MPIAAVLLAAGASTRLGSPKQMARLGGQTLLERAVRTALEAGLRPIYLVVAAGQEETPCLPDLVQHPEAPTVVTVVNPDTAEGMASSLRAGITAAREAAGVIVLACDQPAVTAEHLRELAEGADEIVASAYAGRKGVPAYFPSSAFAELLKLRGDSGARELLQAARAVKLPGGELDVDTVEDLERAIQIYSHPLSK
ncbi:MAG TPA: nucleotidyltransferase family protein [Granulicella sp.]|jgi:molybdenum cofactor cytidylyltransferase|nr:nucleotidyltransferase family protein [Granulicella sp.]